MLSVKIIRYAKSYDFRVQEGIDSFENNWKNNRVDLLVLHDGNKELCRFRCQSVANYCFGDCATSDTVAHGDTVAEGTFTLKCFVPPRNFHGEVHAICSTKDLDGQIINREAMQRTSDGYQNGRWLIHDCFSFKIGRDTQYAWSAGCFILSSSDLASFNCALKDAGVQSGDIVAGEVVEEERGE